MKITISSSPHPPISQIFKYFVPLHQGVQSNAWTHQSSSRSSGWCPYSRTCPGYCVTFSCPSRLLHGRHSYTRLSGSAGHRTAHPTKTQTNQGYIHSSVSNSLLFLLFKTEYILNVLSWLLEERWTKEWPGNHLMC